jgi:hypothetical protein
MNSTDDLTMIRATKKAVKRIDRQLGPKLEATRGGRWSRPAVVDAALDALTEKLGLNGKAEAA